MSEHIAVAVVHGIGMQGPGFAAGFQEKLTRQFAQELEQEVQDPAGEIFIKPVYWASVLQNSEDVLWKRLRQGGAWGFTKLRKFLVDFAADAFAYQPIPKDRTVYDGVHAIFAETLRSLAADAGGKAPLCVVAHSLGSVIASNYFYDLQKGADMISEPVRVQIGDTPLERGETFSHFYTLSNGI